MKDKNLYRLRQIRRAIYVGFVCLLVLLTGLSAIL